MKIQLSIKNTFYKTSVFLLIFFGLTACRSSDNLVEGNNNKQAVVKINMLGAESEEPSKSASANDNRIYSATHQRQIIPFDKKFSIVATLKPENTSAGNTLQTSVNPTAGTMKREKLNIGNEYVVVVYDDAGNYVDEKTFTYGQEQPGFQLTGGKSYTFVAYSVNYTSMVNRLPKDAPLSQAKLENITSDLMFFKKTLTLTGGQNNYLDVVLKHRYSQITTKIDASPAGNITDINGAVITPVNSYATINFANPNQLLYGPVSSTGTPIEFPTKNQQIITSTPTLLISDATTSGELNIKSLTVAGITRNDIKINNLKITPGVRYGLDLKVDGTLRTIRVLSIKPDGYSSNLEYSWYVSRQKMDNKTNFGPNGTVRIAGFEYSSIDLSLPATTDESFQAAVDNADIIWIGWTYNSTYFAPGSVKRQILENAIANKKKFVFTGNDNSPPGYTEAFPGRQGTFAGFTFDYYRAASNPAIVVEPSSSGAVPTKGAFGTLATGETILQSSLIGKVTGFPAGSRIFLLNPDGSANGVAKDNFVSVADVNWFTDTGFGGGNSCTTNNNTKLFCNIIEMAVNYIKNQP